MTIPATNLDDVYRACDPDHPLGAEDERYVDLSDVRGTKVIATTIARRIERSEQGQYYQQLFTGHRGSGKSTELFRLKKELETRKFFAIYIDVEELLDLADLDYLDVLLSIIKQTEETLRKENIILNEELLQAISDWFAEKIIEDAVSTDFSAGIETQAEAKAEIPFFAKLMARLTANIKTSASQRVTTRNKLKNELAVFIERLNTLLMDARNKVKAQGYKDIVLIVDGLEKMHYRMMDDKQSSHAHLFVLHAEQLKAPRCHIVYTTPISLAFNANLGNDFDDVQILPMVKTNEEGITCLTEVIAKRVDIPAIFKNTQEVRQLISLSGGVMRDLMRLIRLATDTDNAQIDTPEIEYAQRTLVREYDRLLKSDELEQLEWVYENKRVTGDEAYARMLNLRLILEYQNGERWAELHPAITHISWFKEHLAKND
jgi:hypothetical protein